MPHEFTQDDLDTAALEALERRRRRMIALESPGEPSLQSRLRESLERRRAARKQAERPERLRLV